MSSLQGFDDPNQATKLDDDDENDEPIKKKNFKKSGGFQSMNLSFNILKGITKRGYKQPTPIQRKAIPIILEGRDVVAMARTGSGKTAAFLIPLFEKLKIRSAKAGARALILSPTRELALQTLRFIKEVGRFLDLKSSVILGGDSMEEQFSAIHGNPDIIVATPGRFLHVCMEMELKLDSVEYVVFDEADRLFEMGLTEQLTEIIARLPDARQTVLFSATLPKLLVEFAKAGLSDPVLIRLDVESKLPNELQLWYLTVKPNEKLAGLLVLLKSVINPKQQTIVFAATKHHVEYLHAILDKFGISNTYIYSNLDPAARKINAAKFSTGRVKVLIVTDVAARGIDIPQLDNVINYNFPAKPKLFVHRVGRCARAGRSGTAYSLVSPDEYAHLLDLHLFLGRPMSITTSTNKQGIIGAVSRPLLEEQHSSLLAVHENNAELSSLQTTADNAYQQYCRSRPAASRDSNKRIKDLPLSICGVHPIFRDAGLDDYLENDENADKRDDLLDQMKNYRPHGTIFEICGKNKSIEYRTMKVKRAFHKDKITEFHKALDEKHAYIDQDDDTNDNVNAIPSSDADVSDTFNKVILPKKRKIDNLYNKKTTKNKKQKTSAGSGDDVFIPYAPADQHTEEGLNVGNFHKDANHAVLDFTGDSQETFKMSRSLQRWDRKKKKMVAVENPKTGKIRTESGAWIPATYKTNRYDEWREKHKVSNTSNDDNDVSLDNRNGPHKSKPNTHWARHNEKVQQKQRKTELKSQDQILKARMIADKKKHRQKKKKGKGKRRK